MMDIIIWGAGNWGEQAYWIYINKGRILFYVDKDVNKTGRKVPWGEVKVRPIECIKDYKEAKIIIAVNGYADIEEILEGMGVNRERIEYLTSELLVEYISSGFLSAMLGDKRVINKRYFEEAYLWRCGYAKESYEYYPTLDNVLKARVDERVLWNLKIILRDMECSPARIIALRLMYEYNCFDSECMKMFMDTLLNVQTKDDTVYGLAMDSTHMIHKHFDYTYDDFYLQRRMLLKKLCKKYDLKLNEEIDKSPDGKRVAILCHCDLYFEKNNMARESIIASYANALQKLDIQVDIFVLCSIYRTVDDNVFLREYMHLGAINNVIEERICRYVNLGIQIHRFYDTNIKRRMQKSIDAIVSYNPRYILDMTDECALQPYVLKKKFPIVYLPMRRHMSSSFFDAYITVNKAGVIEENYKYRSITSEKIYEVALGCLPEDNANTIVFKRREFGFLEKDFLLITVGSRLKYEITDEVMDAMVRLLERCANIKWLLVGDKVNSNSDKFIEFVSRRRIRLWGFEDNLTSLYGICDAYFQPDRPGGGLSIRQAMREGLPIIMSDYPSDQKYFMNAEDLISGGTEELTRYAEKLYRDKRFYRQVSMRMKRRANKYSIDEDAKKILSLLELVRTKKNCLADIV